MYGSFSVLILLSLKYNWRMKNSKAKIILTFCNYVCECVCVKSEVEIEERRMGGQRGQECEIVTHFQGV